MLAFIPILTFTAAFLALYNLQKEPDWRAAFLQAMVAWGGYLVAVTEGLSLLRWVTPLFLAAAWGVPVLLIAAWLWRQRPTDLRLPSIHIPPGWPERLLAAGVGLILAVTALVAWLAPPNTWDSLNYHLPRVAHWAQNQAVGHYPTGVDVQNSMPPGAEMMILHFYVLSPGDRLANFVQWFSMLGSIVVVSRLAAQLGAGHRGQWLAAAVAASIPMGIIQASSTMTDYVVAVWTVCLASQVLDIVSNRPTWPKILTAAAAGGLALLAKPVAAAYILPLAVLLAVVLWIRSSPVQFIAWAAAGIALVLLLNTGHLARNHLLYGNPISSENRISEHANQLVTPAGVTSNLLRNMVLHTGTPWGRVNKTVYDGVVQVHTWLGVDVDDPRTTSVGPLPWVTFTTSEDRAGNFFHALLTGIAVITAWAAWRRFGWLAAVYAGVLVAAFLLFSVVFKWQAFASRYHLAFFVLASPLIARVITFLLPGWKPAGVGLLLILASYPFLFSINSRPLIPGDQAKVGSILTEPRELVYFANGIYLYQPYIRLTEPVRQAKCQQVGLLLPGAEAEYPLWILLGIPGSGREIHWIVSGPSHRYADPGFTPCAILCEGCQEQEVFRDLPVVYNDGEFQLFMAPGMPVQP